MKKSASRSKTKTAIDKKLPEQMGRNDPCHCQSGKKYKRCCEPKNEKLTGSPLILVQITFTTEPIPDDEKDYDSLSEEDQETLAQIYHRLRHHPETIKSEKDEYFLTLNRLRDKYQNYPTIWNYISMGYNVIGLRDKVRETVLETYNKFPKYLFAMTSLSNIYLREKKPEKVLEIFANKKSLPEMYPDRTVFHVTEGRAFYHTMAYYYCVKGNIAYAKNHLKLLEQIAEMMEMDDDPLVQHIHLAILKYGGSTKKSELALLKRMLGLGVKK